MLFLHHGDQMEFEMLMFSEENDCCDPAANHRFYRLFFTTPESSVPIYFNFNATNKIAIKNILYN